VRHFIDLGLAAARKRLSQQTGWVHHCYESDGTRHDTIPLYENFCFVLALFRSRMSEDILQGKEMLEKLLAFENEGNFPVYLHEYPQIRDPGLSLDILPILIHLKREFSSIIGDKLSPLISRILQHAEAHSYGRKAKKLAAAHNFALDPDRKVLSSSQLADELIALQLQGEGSIEMISRYWDSVYLGPYARELHEGGAPAPTLFDCFMGQLHKKPITRLIADHPVHLKASLVYPFEQEPAPQEKKPYIWVHDPETKAVHLFWADNPHSFSIQGATAFHHLGNSTYAIDCTLSDEPPKFGEEKSEVACYLDYHPSHALTIDGGRASAFTLDQQVSIQSTSLKLDLKFSILEGEGNFYGHLLRGNRPRQAATRGPNRFNAYDWQLALRTVARKPTTSLRIICKLIEDNHRDTETQREEEERRRKN